MLGIESHVESSINETHIVILVIGTPNNGVT